MTAHEDPEALSAYLDGELDAEEYERVRDHLASCEECTRLNTSLKAASAAVSSLQHVSPTADESRKLRQAALSAAKRPGWFTPARLAGALGAAAVIGAGIIGLSVMTKAPLDTQTAADAERGSLSGAAAPAALSEQSFNSERELLAAAEDDPVVINGASRFNVSDVGEMQQRELRRITVAAEEAQADAPSVESTTAGGAAAAPTPLWDCQRKALQEKPYPTMPVVAKPAIYKGEKAWLLVYAFTYSRGENDALDHIRLQLVRRTDCTLLVEQVFRPS